MSKKQVMDTVQNNLTRIENSVIDNGEELWILKSRVLDLPRIMDTLSNQSGIIAAHSPDHIYRLLTVIIEAYNSCGESFYHMISSARLVSIYHGYNTLLDELSSTGTLLPGEEGIARQYKEGKLIKSSSRKITLEPRYLLGDNALSEFMEDGYGTDKVGNFSKILLTKRQRDTINIVNIKAKQSGELRNAPADRVSLALPAGVTIESLKALHNISDEGWSIQFPSLKRISAGKMKSKHVAGKRCYSDVTVMSSKLHKYLRIDGEELVEIDQSATYLTILPAVMRRQATRIRNLAGTRPNDEINLASADLLDEEANELESCFRSGTDIYEMIAGISVPKATRDEIKCKMNSYLCWKKAGPAARASALPQIDSFFQTRLPNIREYLMQPSNIRTTAESLNRIEQAIFTGASKILNGHGFYCLVKHDAILCKKSEQNDAIVALYYMFEANHVVMNCKVKDPNGLSVDKVDIRDIPNRLNLATVRMAEYRDHMERQRAANHGHECTPSPVVATEEDRQKAARKELRSIMPEAIKIKKETYKGKTRWAAEKLVDGQRWRHRVGAGTEHTEKEIVSMFTDAALADGHNFKFVVVA